MKFIEVKAKLKNAVDELLEYSAYGTIDNIKQDITSSKEIVFGIVEIVEEYIKRLKEYKEKNKIYTFNDIASLAIKIVKEHEEARNELKYSFKEIMIDEYQDTNDIQDIFISQIENNNVYMVGDVNNSAVLFDINNYSHHIVIADKYQDPDTRVYHADKWASKISQATLLSGHKVVHVLLNDCDLNKTNPPLKNLTFKLDMNHGDINMFEVFSADDDELSAFPAQLQKLILMAEQAYETTDSDRSIIRGSLEDVATKYYVEQGMWRYNAAQNRDALRILGIPHEQIPKLEMFVSYLDTEYKAMVNATQRDDEKLHALSVLSITFHNLFVKQR